MKNLGGFVCVRNGFDLDYSWVEAAESLLKVCEQLVLCDSDSTDGTKEAMQRMADKDSRIKVINWPWPKPKGQSHHWFIEWLNFARSHLTTDLCIYLDADEILSDAPECHAALQEAVEQRKCLTVDRINFWRDPQSVIPDGFCCGKWCTRFGPTEYLCVSDEPRHAGERPIVDLAVKEPHVQIFHLGFLRRKDAFYRKARVVLEGWFGRFDPRLEKGESEDKPVWETECEFADKLVPFSGYVPDSAQKWLSERGYHTELYLARLPEIKKPHVEVVMERDGSAPLRVLHSGDFGDLIIGLSVMRAAGDINLFLVDRNITKPIIRRLSVLEPLLKAQPFIHSVTPYEGGPIDWNASEFRTMYHRSQSLGQSHLLHYRGQTHLPPIQVDFKSPWLTCGRNPEALGKIIINRTARYHNPHFPWKEVVAHYGDLLRFVGTQDEHTAFVREFGEVAYTPTATMLEVAELINGSALFIGNQSSPMAIAEGLKHPRIQETCLFSPDCIYGGATYCIEGSLTLPDVGGRGVRRIASRAFSMDSINRIFIPKGGWQYNSEETGLLNTSTLEGTASLLRRKLKSGLTVEESERMVVAQNIERVPRHFARDINMEPFSRAHRALQQAAIDHHPVLSMARGNIAFTS